MRKRRTMYHNDGRHYYTYVFDAPLKMSEALRPVDEVAGTAVDTFTYLVERGDGMFYDSKVGILVGTDKRPFDTAAMWHLSESLVSLVDRGIDPLKILVDRAHEKKMDFIPVVRIAAYGGMKAEDGPAAGGRGFTLQVNRDHGTGVIKELVSGYDIEGVEIDFPGIIPEVESLYFAPDELIAGTAIMTEWLREAARLIRTGKGKQLEVGARIFPTEKMNLAQGCDVRTWINEGLVDYVMPQFFGDMNQDPDLPLEWIVDLAHEHDVSVYGNLQPFVRDKSTTLDDSTVTRWVYPTPENFRATMANYWAKGVDGLCTWFMKWPLEIEQRGVLTEMGDPDLVADKTKVLTLRRRAKYPSSMGYDAPLPVKIPEVDGTKRYPISFYLADDVIAKADRVRRVVLRVHVSNVVTQDRVGVWLNGKSLESEVCLRDFARHDATRDQWLEFPLQDILPKQGANLLEVSLESRPTRLVGGVTIEELEVRVEYGPHAGGMFPVVTA
ncbi:MAG: hypothetical protein O3A47_13635 [Chloroflexi bacterium]|nr:hypothetical protein [Chloroflexota bacterium]